MKFYQVVIITLTLILTACNQQLSTEEYINNGEEYFTNKQWKSAIIEFKNAIKQSPENAHARALLGEAYLNTYSSNAAIKELKRSIDLGVKDERVIVFLGKAYEQLNQNDNILAEVKVDDSQSPSLQADIYAIRAKALLLTNQLSKAREALGLAKSLDENTTDVRLAWAHYEGIKNNEDAQRLWLKPLLERNGGIADAWSQLAQIEQESNNFEKAETAYSRAISLRNIVHIDYVKRALLRISQKNYPAAREDINVLKKAGVSWPVVGHTEGLMSYQQTKYDLAQTQFEKVLSKYPDYLPSRLLIGLTHFHKNNYQSAVTNLELYLSSLPSAQQANFIYAASLLKLGRASVAIPVLVKLKKLHQGNFRVLSLLGNAYLQNNQHDLGIQLLKEVVSLKPTEAQTRLQLGSALLREKSGLVKAQQELIKAIELDPELFQADLMLYMSYMRNKEYSSARKTAKTLKEKQEKNPLGANLLALSYLAEAKKAQAMSELRNTLKSFPSDPLTSNNLARIYLQENNFDEAKKLFLDVLHNHPNHLKTYNQLAFIAAKENDQPAVIDWLKKAEEQNPNVLAPKLLLASQYIRINDSTSAIQLLQAVSVEGKKQPGYILLMAKAKMSAGEYEHAIRALKILLAQKPDLSSAQILLVQSYAQQNKKNKMRKVLEEAVKHSPDNIQVHLMLARLDLYDRKVDDFKRRVSFLKKSYPENRDVQFLNAKIQSSEKGYESAIKTLTEIMTETPHSDVVVDLAKNQWANGDKDSAISGLELWLQENPADKKPLMVVAQFYLAENRNSEAKKTYQSLDTLLPDNAMVLNNLAWLMKDSDVKQGITYAKKALKIDPTSPYIQDTLATLFLESGEFEKALNLSRKAADSKPNLIDIQLNLARILTANNKKNEAKQLLTDLLYKVRNYDKRKNIQKELDKL